MELVTYEISNRTKIMLPLNMKDGSGNGRTVSLPKNKSMVVTEKEYHHPRIQRLIQKEKLRGHVRRQQVKMSVKAKPSFDGDTE
jgi:hypothetical protein